MGKFKIKEIVKKEKSIEQEKEERIKLALRSKPLLKPIPLKGPLQDGILLFGLYKGEKVLDLIADPSRSAYVAGFLLQSKILPKSFKKKIQIIMDRFDPFDRKNPVESLEIVKIVDIDDIPW